MNSEHKFMSLVGVVVLAVLVLFAVVKAADKNTNDKDIGSDGVEVAEMVAEPAPPKYPPLDRTAYDAALASITNGDVSGKWPVKTEYPVDGAILPFNRIIAYYGNLFSKQMGILGELPPDEMLAKLQTEVAAWTAADPARPAIPALHYIAVVAQADAGKSGTYRARMPFAEIDKVIAMADRIDAIVFLDIQTGLSTIQQELPEFETYLKMPNVHLGIDPEFSMKDGSRPGKKIGTYDAADINYVTEYLAKIVDENNLPPKVLVIHRFTQKMVTNYQNIVTRPQVQIVMNMDGWGHHARKFNTYKTFIYPEPVEFTGFKIFYKNDLKEEGSHLLTPAELLTLKPQPVYIQYQ